MASEPVCQIIFFPNPQHRDGTVCAQDGNGRPQESHHHRDRHGDARLHEARTGRPSSGRRASDSDLRLGDVLAQGLAWEKEKRFTSIAEMQDSMLPAIEAGEGRRGP